MTQNKETKKLKTTEDHANYWFYDIGVQVIPFNTRERRPVLPKVEHTEFFERLMKVEEFNNFKDRGCYDNGFIIKLGQIEKGKYKGKYLNALDLDNHRAIQEFCAGRTLSDLSKEMLVEQRPDDSSRCHILWFSNNPVKSLGQQRPATEEGLNFSIKTKGPFFVSNSPNRNGNSYEFVEGCSLDPSVIHGMKNHINCICEKYKIRPRLKIGEETDIVATLEDLHLALALTQNLNGIPAYKMQFFYDIFYPRYVIAEVNGPNLSGEKQERRIGITTKQLSEYYKEQTGQEIQTDKVRERTFHRMEHRNDLLIKYSVNTLIA
jgi:hypothetical protein